MSTSNDSTDTDIHDRLDRLESLVEQQQETIDDQQETIAEQRDRIRELEGDTTDEDGTDPTRPVSRRDAIKAGGLVGLLGLGAGTASADPQGQIGTGSDPLTALYTREVNSDGSLAVDIDTNDDGTGEALRITQDGATTSLLTVNDGGEVNVENGPLDLNGNPIKSSSNGLAFDTGGGTRTLKLGVASSDGNGNTAGGNIVAGHPNNVVNNSAVGVVIGGGGNDSSGKENTAGGNYATVGGGRGNTANASEATVAGGDGNTASGNNATVSGGGSNEASADNATVSGGFSNGASAKRTTVAGGENNTASFPDATVGGGQSNTAGGNNTTVSGGGSNEARADNATVSGGFSNTATGIEATVGGGRNNDASGDNATVGGGDSNTANSQQATVGGGESNSASNSWATVPGGLENVADGLASFAAGKRADTDTNDGAFVWGDSTNNYVKAGAEDEVRFQATGGFVIENTSTVQITDGLPDTTGTTIGIDGSGNLVKSPSSARYKTNIRPLSTDTSRVLDLEPRTFEYEETNDEDTGLIAEDVDEVLPELVHYDEDNRPESVQYDRLGVYLVPEVRENRDRLDDLEQGRDDVDDRLAGLENETDDLQAENEALREENDRLRERNADLESRLDTIETHLGLDGTADRQGVADD